jgi:zinc-dependent metalloproteinase lipoprotein
VEYNESLRAKYPERSTDAEFETWINQKVSALKAERAADSNKSPNIIYKIPVVIHIIHNGDAIGTGENITDAQAASQITVMNQDYRKMLDTRGYNTHPDGADIEIEFCLAKVDPNGAATTGIVRHQLSGTSFSIYQIETTVKPTTIWDPTKYMNMWTVRFGSPDTSVLGYAQFPNNSGLLGLDSNNGGATTDGVVAAYNAFGSMDLNDGTFIMNATYKYGRTMTHEVGHFLGLRHTWGDGTACGATDYCNDTPFSLEANYGCPVKNSCDDTAFGWTTNPNDMVENYMDYTDDQCMNIFTQNQKDRMIVVLQNSPRRVELTTSNVCPYFNLGLLSNPTGTCLPNNASISFNYTPVGGFSETVVFSASGIPAGSTASFSPASASSSITTVTMTVSNLSTTGTSNITITGTGTTITRTTVANLIVSNSNPGSISLQTPANAATNVALAPTFTWAAANNTLNYEIQVSTNNTFSPLIINATSSTNSYTSTVLLSSSTTYYWRVRAVNSCGVGAYSGTFSFTTSNPTYCASTYTESASEYISKVQFNTINKSSGDAPTNGYEDFTTISTNVSAGTSYNLAVTINTAGNYKDHCFAFIDWNKDFVFNISTEKYDLGSIVNVTAGILTQSILIPTTALAGSTRMRVTIEYDDVNNGVGLGPCDDTHLTEYGETEDYTLNITNTVEIDFFFNVYPNPSEGIFNISLQSSNSEKATVQLFDMSGRLISQNILDVSESQINSTIDYSHISEGIYLMRISKGIEIGTKQIIIK